MKRVFAVLIFAGALLAQNSQTGTIAGTTSVVFDGIGPTFSTLTVQITGTFTAQLQFEATVNNVTWNAVAVVPPGTTGTRVTVVTSSGMWQANVAGYLKARVRATSWTSGTITVTGRLSTGHAPYGASVILGPEPMYRVLTLTAQRGHLDADTNRGREVDRARAGWRGLLRT